MKRPCEAGGNKNIESGEHAHKIVDVGEVSKKYISKYVIDLEVRTIVIELRLYEDKSGNHT